MEQEEITLKGVSPKGTVSKLVPPIPRRDLLKLIFKVVPVANIVENRLQPSSRHTESALEGLYDAITKTWVVAPPIVMPNNDGTYMMVDGHRRWGVVKALGVTEWQVAVVDTSEWTPEELFLFLNIGTRPFKGQTWLHCWALARNRKVVLKRCPAKTRDKIQFMIDNLGVNKTVEIGLAGKPAPSYFDAAKTLVHTLTAWGLSLSMRDAAEWTLKHEARVIYDENPRMKKEKRIAERFLRCVREGREFTRRGRDRKSKKAQRTG